MSQQPGHILAEKGRRRVSVDPIRSEGRDLPQGAGSCLVVASGSAPFDAVGGWPSPMEVARGLRVSEQPCLAGWKGNNFVFSEKTTHVANSIGDTSVRVSMGWANPMHLQNLFYENYTKNVLCSAVFFVSGGVSVHFEFP